MSAQEDRRLTQLLKSASEVQSAAIDARIMITFAFMVTVTCQ